MISGLTTPHLQGALRPANARHLLYLGLGRVREREQQPPGLAGPQGPEPSQEGSKWASELQQPIFGLARRVVICPEGEALWLL